MNTSIDGVLITKKRKAVLGLSFVVVISIVVLFLNLGGRDVFTPKISFNDQSINLEFLAAFDRLQAVYVKNGIVYGVEERSVYASTDGGESFDVVGYLPRGGESGAGLYGWLKDTFAKNKFVRNYRRSVGPASLVVLESGTIIVVSDQIYRKAADAENFEVISLLDNQLPPFQSGSSISVGPEDVIYYGEYTVEKEQRAIRVFRGEDDGRVWNVAYTLPPTTVFHVHSITWDKFRQRYWITTGDADEESYIFYTEDEFTTLEVLGGGSQDWRTVAPLVLEDRLIWASDDGRKSSSIFSFNFKSQTLLKLNEVGNPATYVSSTSDGTLLISTTYVPQTEYGHTNLATAETALWASQGGKDWKKVFSLPESSKRLHYQRPQIRLPGGDGSLPIVLATPLYTQEYDFQLLEIKINWD